MEKRQLISVNGRINGSRLSKAPGTGKSGSFVIEFSSSSQHP
jgi:hypothetical protein